MPNRYVVSRPLIIEAATEEDAVEEYDRRLATEDWPASSAVVGPAEYPPPVRSD